MASAAVDPIGRGINAALYLHAARLAFRRQLAYPAATFWGLVTNLFFGALRVAVLLALFGARPQVAGYTQADAITYTGLTQGLLSAYAMFGWTDLMRTIHRGEVATDLLRPHSFLGFWMAQDAGRAAAQFLLRGLSILLLYALIWGLEWPASPVLTLVSALLAWACGFGFRFWVNTAAFWSANATGIGRFAWAWMALACGFLMPLAFFPDWMQRALAATPFPSMMNTTIEVWLGVRAGHGAVRAVAVQAAWTVAMLLVARWSLARGLRRLEVAGG